LTAGGARAENPHLVNDATRIAWLMVAGGAFLLLSSWNDYRWLHVRKRRGFELDDTVDTDRGSRSMRRMGYFLLGIVVLVAGAGHLGGGWDLGVLMSRAPSQAAPAPAEAP
jgi:hypothetical protein